MGCAMQLYKLIYENVRGAGPFTADVLAPRACAFNKKCLGGHGPFTADVLVWRVMKMCGGESYASAWEFI